MRLQKKWLCPKCGFPCRTRDELRKHRRIEHADIIKNRPKPYSWECPICHQVFKSRRVLERHRIDEHGKYVHKPHIATDKKSRPSLNKWECKYCHQSFDTRKLLFSHYKICEEKLKLPVDCRGRVINYEAIQKGNQTKAVRSSLGLYKSRKVSKCTREKLSTARKQYLLSHRVKYNWNGYSRKLSYAEQYFYDIVSKQCAGVNWKNNLRVSYYRLDFANLDTKVYFEVDGEQHYDEYGLYHDSQRTARLEALGWKLIGRVRWKYFTRLTDDEKDKYVNEILNAFMSNTYITVCALAEPK